MLLGSPSAAVDVVWAVAAVLSALSAMLAAPLIGSGSSFTSGPALLLPALAAAVLADGEPPGAMLAGIGVGGSSRRCSGTTPGPAWSTSVSSAPS